MSEEGTCATCYYHTLRCGICKRCLDYDQWEPRKENMTPSTGNENVLTHGTNAEPDELTRIFARHKRRLFDNLEAAQCPAVYREAVRKELDWLRDDVREACDASH